MLATTDGFLTMLSTPNGMNGFWRFFEMGRDRQFGIWSRHGPSSENPIVTDDFLAVQRELLPDRIFQIE